MITQAQLKSIYNLRRDIAKLMEAAAAASVRLNEKESIVVLALGAGEVVSQGAYTAFMEKTPGKCAPRWKEVYLAHMTDDHGLNAKVAEDNIRADYPAVPGQKLVVGEVS